MPTPARNGRRGTFLVEQGAHAADLAHPAVPWDPAIGLTKRQAVDLTGVKIRTVEGWAKQGLLRKQRRRDPVTGQHVTVYHPDDVVERAAERQPGPPTAFLVPGTASNGNGHSAGLQRTQTPAVDPDQVRTVAAFVLAVLTEVRSQAPQAAQGAQGAQTARVYLTVREAAAFTGLRPTFLKRMIAAGTLSALQDGRVWKIRKKDLEAL